MSISMQCNSLLVLNPVLAKCILRYLKVSVKGMEYWLSGLNMRLALISCGCTSVFFEVYCFGLGLSLVCSILVELSKVHDESKSLEVYPQFFTGGKCLLMCSKKVCCVIKK